MFAARSNLYMSVSRAVHPRNPAVTALPAWVPHPPRGRVGWWVRGRGGKGGSLFPLTPAKQAMCCDEPGRAGMWLATRDQLGRFIADPLWDKETALAINVKDDAAAVYKWGYPGKPQGTNSTLSARSISVHSALTQCLSHSNRCLRLNGLDLVGGKTSRSQLCLSSSRWRNVNTKASETDERI